MGKVHVTRMERVSGQRQVKSDSAQTGTRNSKHVSRGIIIIIKMVIAAHNIIRYIACALYVRWCWLVMLVGTNNVEILTEVLCEY